VVAEGIEIARQRDRLIDLGCRFAQGNFFSEPLEAQLAGQLLLLGGAGGPHLRSGDRPGALT